MVFTKYKGYGMNVDITKKNTETYTLRGDKCLWAKINLECGEESVNVMISSDYGEYNYYWGSCGMDPKQFLIKLNWHYCMKKLMQGTDNMYEPDWSERKKSFKELVIALRKEYRVEKELIRKQWDRMIEIFDDCGNSIDLYYTKVINEELFWQDEYPLFYDVDSIPEDRKLQPQVMRFWNDLWTPFIMHLKEETVIKNKTSEGA